MTTRLLLTLAVLLMSPGVSFADWLKNCRTGSTATSLIPGEFACHNPTGANDDAGLINVAACENIDVFWYDDVAGGAADADGTADLYTCPVVASTLTDSEAEREAACQPLDGTTQLTAANTEAFAVGVVVLWVDTELESASNQLLVKCAQPSQK